LHGLPPKSTTNTLSFFVIYMSHHIKLSSVGYYLSRICNSLELYYPNVCTIHSTSIICCSLTGTKKLHSSQPTPCKQALECDDLLKIITVLPLNPPHDNLLFITMLLTGFHGPLRIGELTVLHTITKCTTHKLTLCLTLVMDGAWISFTLPFHKSDHFYTGNTIMVQALPHSPINPMFHLCHYITSCDRAFPLLPAFWLSSSGQTP
ncbi:hypothetical protein M422DRAFT_102405, partial [Sphaerobolus stellatus SS14]